MALLETVAHDVATIVVHERRCNTAACREATEAAAIGKAANAVRDTTMAHMEAVKKVLREKADRAADDEEEEHRVAEVAAAAMAWGLLGKEDEEHKVDLWQEEAERVAEEENRKHCVTELDAASVRHEAKCRRLEERRADHPHSNAKQQAMWAAQAAINENGLGGNVGLGDGKEETYRGNRFANWLSAFRPRKEKSTSRKVKEFPAYTSSLMSEWFRATFPFALASRLTSSAAGGGRRRRPCGFGADVVSTPAARSIDYARAPSSDVKQWPVMALLIRQDMYMYVVVHARTE
ncbi:hypothetical protein QYE76_055485 [Lolium multiflorum]|uniref:Uncharacterized protein n=1 Tax=Lolium multiflorum TaxID=4521 RepID=A0AAD8T145_LOLMU|nr:hypothetical protein QYE76_055485 [Lolium multiflorum]